MVEDGRVRGTNVGFKAAVEETNLTPVAVKSLDIVVADASSEVSLFESHADGTHGRLGRKAGHACRHKKTLDTVALPKIEVDLLSMARSTTSAPAAAQAIMLAAAMPAVSWEWT